MKVKPRCVSAGQPLECLPTSTPPAVVITPRKVKACARDVTSSWKSWHRSTRADQSPAVEERERESRQRERERERERERRLALSQRSQLEILWTNPPVAVPTYASGETFKAMIESTPRNKCTLKRCADISSKSTGRLNKAKRSPQHGHIPGQTVFLQSWNPWDKTNFCKPDFKKSCRFA